MTEPRRWLDSRHLQRGEPGRSALAALESLDVESRAAILARGDELAGSSVGLAHAWLVASVTARSTLSPPEAARWERGFLALLGEAGVGRATAMAYLALDATRIGTCPHALTAGWIDATRRLQVRSQRLAASFLDAFGRLLVEHRGDVEPDAASAWSDAVIQTLAASRWRGELLATRLIESVARLPLDLSPTAIAHWARTLTAIGQAGRTPRCPQPPQALAHLAPALRERVLQIAADTAAADSTAGESILETLAAAAAATSPDGAHHLLDAMTVAGHQPGLADAVALLAASMHEIDRRDHETVLAHSAVVAREFPAGLAAFFRTIGRAFDAGGARGVALWVQSGIEIGRRSTKAGVAHLQLETRTAHKLLVEHSPAVAFEEIEAVLQRYAVMIARRPLHLACGGGVWLRPPLSAPDDAVVRLPERIDLFATSEDNQLFYKLAVAHAAARWELGTYALRVDRLREHGIEPFTEPVGSDIVSLLDSFPNPLLAAGLFVVLEGARIDSALAREFRGLAADLDRLGRLYAELPLPAADRAPDALIEALFLMSVGRLQGAHLPARLRPVAHIAERTLATLRRPEATVYDSARLLLALYRSLTLAAAVAGRDDDLSTFLEMGGATVLDPLEYLEGGQAPQLTDAAAATHAHEPSARANTTGDVEASELALELSQKPALPQAGTIPLTPEQIRKLIEDGVDLEIVEAHGEDQASLGLYITELLGKLPAEAADRLRRLVADGDTAAVRAWLATERGREFQYYDEWDYQIGDYRRRWCRLAELEVEGDGGRYVNRLLVASADLIGRVRHEFLRLRPEQFRKVRGMEHGDDFDLNALVDAHADRRTRRSPSDRLYVARRREERDVATLFLLDMSASTDEPVPGSERDGGRRVIDVTKDTLVVMGAVLAEIGDAYAVYGFSGHGRENVECYQVKTFAERWGQTVRGRIGGIEPKRSTRMGAALRHAGRKLSAVSARARHLILLSDGFPQDYDYGDDRRSNVYGIRDTTVALQELEEIGIKTFCITVDPAGHDYLRDMCPATRYAVIDDVEALPEELPRIYRSVTR